MAVYNPSSSWQNSLNNIKPVNVANAKPYAFPTYTAPFSYPKQPSGPNPIYGGSNAGAKAQTNYDKNNPYGIDNFKLPAALDKAINNPYSGTQNNNTNSSYGGSSGGGGYASNPFGDLLSQMQERENQRYAQNKSYIENAFSSLLGNLRAGYDSGVDTVNKNADKAQQEAYVNNMKAQRDLPQSLSALGITGGASESTAASMQNSYGQSRNATDNSRVEAISQLLQQLNSATSSLDAEKSNQLMNVYNSNTDNLNAIAESYATKQADYAAKQFNARNAAELSSVKQAESVAKAKIDALQNNPYYKQAKTGIEEGKAKDEIKYNLISSGMNPIDVDNFLNNFYI